MKKTIVFNGKFLSAQLTGVHRVAAELLCAIDRYAHELAGPDDEFAVIVRRDAEVPAFKTIRVIQEHMAASWLHRIAWEQLYLPLVSRGCILINLCNIGPVLAKNSITMIHDAQIYSTPASYGTMFRAWYRLMLPLLGRRHKRILTVSEYSKSELERYGISTPDKIQVAHNGADHIARIQQYNDIVKKLNLQNEKYVIALSNTQKHKNIEILFKAFSLDEIKGYKLVLFGNTKKKDFQKIGHTIPANVLFTGRLSDEQLVGLFAQAGALAFPSLTEGFGLPPLEAMLLGCPVIAAPCGALPETCGDAALFAAPDQPEAWAATLRKVLENQTLRENLKAKGREQAARFTWQKAAGTVISAAHSLSAGKNRACDQADTQPG